MTQKQVERQELISKAKKMYVNGNTQTEIAREIGISQASVSLYIK